MSVFDTDLVTKPLSPAEVARFNFEERLNYVIGLELDRYNHMIESGSFWRWFDELGSPWGISQANTTPQPAALFVKKIFEVLESMQRNEWCGLQSFSIDYDNFKPETIYKDNKKMVRCVFPIKYTYQYTETVKGGFFKRSKTITNEYKGEMDIEFITYLTVPPASKKAIFII